jgi:hypothetical protein
VTKRKRNRAATRVREFFAMLGIAIVCLALLVEEWWRGDSDELG